MKDFKRSNSVVSFEYNGKRYSLSSRVCDEFGLFDEFEMNDDILSEIIYRDEFLKIYEKALNLISYREHFSMELKLKLQKRNFEREIIEDVISLLKSENLVDDKRAAKLYIESKADKYGKNKIKANLKSKGLNYAEIESVLETENSEYNKLKDIIENKINLLGLKKPYSEKELSKLARFAYNRGFSSCDIYKIIVSLR